LGNETGFGAETPGSKSGVVVRVRRSARCGCRPPNLAVKLPALDAQDERQ